MLLGLGKGSLSLSSPGASRFVTDTLNLTGNEQFLNLTISLGQQAGLLSDF